MSGAITILVAKGQQDTVLTDNPQISFFRQNYKRHVNFSQAVLSQVIQGQPAEGAISTVTFDNKGDMLSYVYLTKKVNGVVQQLTSSDDIEKIDFIIGEQIIDTLTTRQLSSLQRFSPKYPQTDMGVWVPDGGPTGGILFTQFHYPLGFWFCQNWQSAIPLVALQYHKVQIRITWGEAAGDPDTSYDVWANYIYLDNAERDYITNRGTSDTLIYQHQSSPPSNSLMSILPFNNPVSFLFTDQGGTDIMGETVSKDDNAAPTWGKQEPAIVGTGTAGLQINGVDIVEKKELYPHYNMIPCSYHTTYGKADVYFGTTAQFQQIPSFIYPFALNCSQLQPSGTCNFSRIDSAYLTTSKNMVKPIHARSYNVLRIQNGMGGLLFSL